MTKQEIFEELERIYAWNGIDSRKVAEMLIALRDALWHDIAADYIANEAANEEEGMLPGRL